VVLEYADGLTIDPLAGLATYLPRSISLPRREASLLALLIEALDRVMAREEIVDRVWQGANCGPRTVDVNVYRLRSKLRAIGHPGVTTVYRRGYRLASRR
jgi:DNA-binding winged helix-turn-helix (wHTH) protein